VLYGRCDEEAGVPYPPFVEALRRWVAAQSPAQRAGIPRAEHLARLIPELTDVAAAPALDDPEVERYRFFEAVASTLAHAASAGAAVLVLDDLHWADRPTLQLLRHVLRTRATTALFVIGTYRESDLARTRPFSETLPDIRRERHVGRIRLAGLDEAEIVELFERTIQHDVGHRGRELAHALSETTDGNPFFIEQVIGNLVDTGTLVQREGRTILDARVSELAIPEGVIEAVGRRLSRLSDECNQALAAGSVIGRDFEVGVLRRMVAVEPDALLGAIDEALSAGLVREVPGSGRAPAYSFSHALVQQTLYEELSLARKQRLHLRAGAAIEAEHAGSLDAHVVQLARHLRAAGTAADAMKTIDYSLRAMQVTRRVFAFEEAIAHAEAALELISETDASPAVHARVLENLGDLLYVAGADYARGVSLLEDALRRYKAMSNDAACARIHAKLGRAFGTFWGFLDIPRALEHVLEAERLFGESPEPLTHARLLLSKGNVLLYSRDIDQGEAIGEEVLAMAKELGDGAISSMAMSLQAWAQLWRGQREEGRALTDEAWRIADGLDHLSAAFIATWTPGSYLVYSDPRECYAVIRRELENPRQLRASNLRHVLLTCAQDALQMCGDLDGARRVREEMDPSIGFGIYALPEMRYEFLAGDWERARRMVAPRVDQHRKSGAWIPFAFESRLLGDILWAQGAVEPAVAAYEEAAKARWAVEWWEDWTGVARLRLAEVDALQGNVERARAHVTSSEAYFQQGSGARGLIGFLDRARAMLAAAEERDGDADAAFQAAVDVFERYEFCLEQAATLSSWGRTLLQREPARARQLLDAALSIYRRCGAGPQWIESLMTDVAATE
jgi:tetratricopeptide (TPR) repeat protein